MTQKSAGWSDFRTPGAPFGINMEAFTSWARLWLPEIVAGLVSAVLLFRFLHPHATAPWPGLGDAFGDTPAYRAWRDGLQRPEWWEIALWSPVGMAPLVAAYLLDFRRERNRRRKRMLRYRWERTEVGKVTSLKRIALGQGIATADCTITDGTWDDLEKSFDVRGGTFLRGLRLDKAWGVPIRASLTETGYSNHPLTQGLTLSFIPLGDPWKLPTYEKPAQGLRFMIGWTVQGSHEDADELGRLWIDLEATPHVAVRGTSGVGKGFFIRLLEIQALYAGYLVLLIDGGNSPEHAAGDWAATFWRPMRSNQQRAQRLQAAVEALEALIEIIDMRSQLAELFFAHRVTKSSRWSDMPEDVRRWQPPVGVIVDETTTLLGKSGNPVVDKLQDRLRYLLGSEVLRGGRKFQVHILPISDQTSTYTAALARADQLQAEHIIILGQFDQTQAQAATGVKLPRLPRGVKKLAGFKVERDNPDYAELRVPPNTENELRRAAEWVGGGAFQGRQLVDATSRPKAAAPLSPVDELAARCTENDGHLICPPLPGQKKATIGGKPAVNVAWFVETGEWPTPAHNLRSTCNVEHCVSPQCRHEWERSANSAQPMSEGEPT